MEAKMLVVLFIVINCYSSCGAALRRTPKVYNALITTDENLTSSRAYPVIQPTIHETGIASYPFGPYNPFGLYSNSLLRFPPPLVPGLSPNDQLAYPFQSPSRPPIQHQQPQNPVLPPNTEIPYQFQVSNREPISSQQPQHQFPQQYQPEELPSGPPTGPSGPGSLSPSDLESQSQNEVIPPPSAPPQEPISIPIQNPQMQPSEKLPLPLNEYGLPPSLIPLQPFPQRNRQPLPLNFSPYPYQSFPVLYEPYNRFHQDQYLPPYDYFPNNNYGIPATPQQKLAAKPTISPKQPEVYVAPTKQQPEPTTQAPTKVQLPTEIPLESIKNDSPNKNKDVPDVPPPPIPSGANSTNNA